jgi:hypothetical protein
MHFIGEQDILAVNEENAEFFRLGARHGGGAIIQKRFPDARAGRPITFARASLSAAASTVFSAATVPSLTLSTSNSRSSGAAMTSAKLPNLAISALARGLVSRCGIARNSSNSIGS